MPGRRKTDGGARFTVSPSLFEYPLTSPVLMIFKWAIWLLLITGFFSFVIRFLTPLQQTIVYPIFATAAFVQAASTIYSMTVDTVDKNVKHSNVPRNLDFVKQFGFPVIDPMTLYCGICQVHVEPKTKHCKVRHSALFN